MNDISGPSSAGDAVALSGVNLSLGRGAARVHILRDIGLYIGRGEAVALLGPSGSGKSTLLMVMTGLEQPDSGSVVVAGQDLRTLDEDGLARFRGTHVGIVFQAFHLIPTMTALENVAVPLELAGQRDALARAQRELAAVGLGQRLHHYPAELSGGEQQRVALARALVNQPALVLADEPTGNLDTENSNVVLEMLRQSNQDLGQTVLMITHNPEAASYGDRIIHMRDGRIVRAEEDPQWTPTNRTA
jgi:putative ABC transport system ATP-binding protein